MRKFGFQIIQVPYSSRRIKSGFYNWLVDLDINTVIDIGANEGQFAKTIRRIIPKTKIYSFEPLIEPFTQLKKNFQHDDSVYLFNFALGEQEKECFINHNNFSPSSSLLEGSDLLQEAFPNITNSRKEKIKIKRIDSVLGKSELKFNILLKIDVQGYELGVLKGAKNILINTKIILIEVSFFALYKGQPLFDDIYNFLIERDFEYKGNLEQIYDTRDGKILQADAIFIKLNKQNG